LQCEVRRQGVPVVTRMPMWWHNSSCWEHGLTANSILFSTISDMLSTSCCTDPGIAWCRSIGKSLCQWVADVVGWLILTSFALICDGWVIPRKGHKPPDQKTVQHTCQTCALDRVEQAASSGLAPRALLYRCYGWLKPAEPTPPPFLVVDGRTCTAEESHAAWCEHVRHQRVWPLPWDEEYDEAVRQRVKSLLGQAWQRRARDHWTIC